MKNRIIIYLACLAGLVLASSCSTHDTIMKRRYMKGYYVSKQQRAHSSSTAQAKTDVKNKPETEGRLSVSLEPEKLEGPLLTQRTNVGIIPIIISETTRIESAPVVAGKRVMKAATRLHEISQLRKPVARDSEGLSLFWVVILVILILWAIGFLGGGFGIGGLINLLLVVALVLLILWLLRII